MKPQPRSIDTLLRRPPPGLRAILCFGPDTGLVRERGRAAALAVVEDLADPFRVTDLSTASVAADPVRLYDEMAAMALTGGRRLVRIRDADDGLTNALTTLLKDPPGGDSLLVMEAGDLARSSKLRTLCEASDLAAAIACYVEGEEELAGTITRILGEHGLSVEADARQYLAGCLTGDRQMARTELDKLSLYLLGRTVVTLEDARAVIGDSGEQGMDEPALAAADGDFNAVDRSLHRLFAEGVSPVPVLRAAQRHFQRLHLAVAATGRGQTPQQAVKSLRPPVFWKQEAQVTAQVRRWTLPLLAQALARILETEAECKRTGMPDEVLCARAFYQLAQWGRRG